MINHGLTIEDADRLLDSVVEFPDIGATFERVRPITDFRKDDNEARIVYICRRIQKENSEQPNGHDARNGDDSLYILKCKVQAPSVLAGGLTTPIAGPSEYTQAELKALKTFADTKSTGLPHLITWKKTVQPDHGPMPGGYIAYVVMTLLPGRDLMESKFWSMTKEEQDVIRDAFIPLIKHVWGLGFDPYDTALRNILWEPETKQLSIVDFEHWHPSPDPINMSEREEKERWGLLQRPPPKEHWREWFYSERLTQRKTR